MTNPMEPYNPEYHPRTVIPWSENPDYTYVCIQKHHWVEFKGDYLHRVRSEADAWVTIQTLVKAKARVKRVALELYGVYD